MINRKLCPIPTLAVLFLLGVCAALKPEPRLPRTTAAAETRRDLLAAGLRPGAIEGPRGSLRYFEGGKGKTVVLLHGSGSQAGHDRIPSGTSATRGRGR